MTNKHISLPVAKRSPQPARLSRHAAVLALAFFAFTDVCKAGTADATPSSLVDIGAESGEGRLFKGAALPFGMVMWGPNSPHGYSVTCLSGAEMDNEFYDFVSVLPTTRPIADAARESGVSRVVTGEPGYCRSQIAHDVLVELAAGRRAGIGRFTPPEGKPLSVLVGASRVRFDAAHRRISGSHQLNCRGGVYTVCFAAEFDHEFTTHGVIRKGAAQVTTDPGEQTGLSACYVTFDKMPAGKPLHMRLGMSYVSPGNALMNLEAEIPGWDFEKVRTAARRRWDDALGAIKISGGEENQRRLFYTCLYRTLLQPNTFSDANGEYSGFDGKTHVAKNRVQYANYSIWDIYRTWVELAAILYPGEAADMMQSLVEDARECGGAMPRWPVANRETGTMEEGSATPLVCSAYAFGATSFDVKAAFEIMDKMESKPGVECQGTEAHEGLADFLKLGYVPQGRGNLARSASFSLEYSTAAFTLAQLAKSLGKTDRFEFYMKNARNWANLYHEPTGYLHARNRDGSWCIDSSDPAGCLAFTEGNAAQFTWTIRHDMRSLIERVGGNAVAAQRLDALCGEWNAGPRKPLLWIGNEPSFTIPWAYDWIGRPDRTDEIIHDILTKVWRPGTTPGAEDLGAMSAWYVWASIGLYPAIPGVGGWTLNGPLFDAVAIRLPGGRELRINAKRPSLADIHVQSVALNGKPWTSTWLPIAKLSGAKPTIEFTLGPAGGWGKQAHDAPPSY